MVKKLNKVSKLGARLKNNSSKRSNPYKLKREDLDKDTTYVTREATPGQEGGDIIIILK